MKKYLIGGVVAAAFIAYAIFANNNNNQPITPVAPTATSTGTPNTNGPTSTIPATTPPAGNPPGTPVNTPATTTTPTGQYKDGSYTGAVADAFYGNLQVIAVIQGGALADVQFPQHPSGGHSGEVAAYALPQLRQEAIAAQSANVDAVSGATQDSNAFQQSLASALAQAKT